jgi:hypothetical protein
MADIRGDCQEQQQKGGGADCEFCHNEDRLLVSDAGQPKISNPRAIPGEVRLTDEDQ